MAASVPYEMRLLAPAMRALDEEAGRSDHRARLEILEAVASSVSGIDLRGLRRTIPANRTLSLSAVSEAATRVLAALEEYPAHPSLAIAALGREPLPNHVRRSEGQYYTDFRLAMHLASTTPKVPEHLPVLDPASGSGILLAAFVLTVPPDRRDQLIHRQLCAADKSELALRSCLVTIASLSSRLESVRAFAGRALAHDSLIDGVKTWRTVAPSGFGLVIGNPPWEKLKVTRHEFLVGNGVDRHYGAEIEGLGTARYEDARARVAGYASRLGSNFSLARGGEVDLYQAFMALGIELLAESGTLAFLVPAGLIRSSSTRVIREHLLGECERVRIGISDNRARYFGIDSRFKFLCLTATVGRGRRDSVALEHLDGGPSATVVASRTRIGRSSLRQVRPDLTVPEVRSNSEWRLFKRLSSECDIPSDPDSPWHVPIVREVDMTRDRRLFLRKGGMDELPVIEGRMVSHFQSNAKKFESGSGRRAEWSLARGGPDYKPQFYVDPEDLSPAVAARTRKDRIGFCDVSGQTNERSLLAARIPAGVVCGNKVPTLRFSNEEAELGVRDWVWLALANSFIFDWLLRRVMTTSVNYFLLRSIPMPRIDLRDPVARALASDARALDAVYQESSPQWSEIAALRARLDANALRAYGCGPSEFDLIWADFPLVDSRQPIVTGESRSTVTRDMVLASLGDAWSDSRVELAREHGAEAYVRSEVARTISRVPKDRVSSPK